MRGIWAGWVAPRERQLQDRPQRLAPAHHVVRGMRCPDHGGQLYDGQLRELGCHKPRSLRVHLRLVQHVRFRKPLQELLHRHWPQLPHHQMPRGTFQLDLHGHGAVEATRARFVSTRIFVFAQDGKFAKTCFVRQDRHRQALRRLQDLRRRPGRIQVTPTLHTF